MSGVIAYFGARAQAQAVAAAMGAAMCHGRETAVIAGDAGPTGALGHIGVGPLHDSARAVRDGHAVLLCMCGEFYYRDRREAAPGSTSATLTDAQFALDAYLRAGADGLARLDGAFVTAVWDGRAGEVIVVNDRFGLYQHFFAHIGSALVVAPEIKGVLAAPEVSRRLDTVALSQYVRFQQFIGERTWLEDVSVLPPGSILRFRPGDGAFELTRHWDWDRIAPVPRLGLREAVEEATRLFQRAIDEMTRPPLRPGVYLSGGLDGRTILGFIPQQTPATAVTFGEQGCRDVVYGAELARRAGRPHRWFPFAGGAWVLDNVDRHMALTEGLHGWVNMHGISTLDAASQLFDVHLSGWDGGTTLGGRVDEYATDAGYRHAPDEAAFVERMFAGFCHTFTWPGMSDADAAALFGGAGRAEVAGLARESFAAEAARTAHYPPPYRADYFYILQRVRRSTQCMIVFQRSAFEVRCPYFDYAFIDFLYGLPEALRASPALHHGVLTRRMPALARVPNEKDDRLPHSNPVVGASHAALQKAKRGVNKLAGPVFPRRPRLYADYENYLRTDLRPWAEGILFDARTRERGLFDPKVVRQLWERHLQGDRIWTLGSVAPLITIEMSIRHLIDPGSSSAPTSSAAAGLPDLALPGGP